MSKTVYVVYHGTTIPRERAEFKSWKQAQKFIKDEIDKMVGTNIHSVYKENAVPEDTEDWRDY